jgi:hypothetical protein
MEFIKIILHCILSAIGYGIVHDLITAHLCVEYFTVAHPPVFHTESPTFLALGWGVIATWWVGLFLGIPLAAVARLGTRSKITVGQLVPSILRLLGVMAIMAASAGVLGYVLAARGVIQVPAFMAAYIPQQHRVGFMADWWAHSASYLSGFLGGLVVIVMTWFKRKPAAG